MTAPAYISICIPAYKNSHFLTRVLDSIAQQSYRDFEMVITDDSPDESVATLVDQYRAAFPILYQRNAPALGSPGNWNASIRLATGQWIKMMHDDDWFAGPDSLQQFADAARQTEAPFIYSGYYRVEEATGQRKSVLPVPNDIRRLCKQPAHIIAFNVIGHPSVTMIRRSAAEVYDEQLKWLVDVEYYHRFLRKGQFLPLPQPLVCIGMNAEQITKAVFRNPAVEIPENLYVLNKLGLPILRSPIVYDHFWRMIRNLQIREVQTLQQYGKGNDIPRVICGMVRQQSLISASLLKVGAISKIMMLISWAWSGLTRQRIGN